MATYKVLQDIEAEDKLVGPLTLKQFIYAGITALCAYISFLGITKHFPYVMIVFAPIGLLTGFFAFPWGKEQPTEIWALAKIRFLFIPRRRIWDQSGAKQLVTITAPKKIETNYTNGLSETEIKSRLHALADTIDSRGWAVKNVNVNLYSQSAGSLIPSNSDRLVDPSTLPQEVPSIDVQASDDILDEQSSPVAQHFEQMINASTKAHRQQVVAGLQAPQQQPTTTNPPNDYWFMNQSNQPLQPAPGYTTFQNSPVITPHSDDPSTFLDNETPEEAAAANELRERATEPIVVNSHLHTIQPLSLQSPTTGRPTNNGATAPTADVTGLSDSVKMRLAQDNNRSVASLEREANQPRRSNPDTQDEVVVPLH